MQSEPAQHENEAQFLLVRSGGHRCAIPVGAAKLVTGAPVVHPLPSSEPRLLGLAQVSGEPVAVVDLHALLDPLGDPGCDHELTIIIRGPEGRSPLGLAVDEAFGVVSVAERTEPAADDPSFVAGRSSVDDRPIVILDPEALFGSEMSQ